MLGGWSTFVRTLVGLGVSLPLALKAYIEYVKFATAKKIADILAKEKEKK